MLNYLCFKSGLLDFESAMTKPDPQLANQHNGHVSNDHQGDRPSASAATSHLISKVLSPAIAFWLRSQLDAVEMLQVKIDGGDRQILAGHIPTAEIMAVGAIYQNIHLQQVHVSSNDIRINLGQMMRGQPFRLLQPLSVWVEGILNEAGLIASLNSPSLTAFVADFLTRVMPDCALHSDPPQQTNIAQFSARRDMKPLMQLVEAEIGDDWLMLKGHIHQDEGHLPLSLKTQVMVSHGQILQFKHLCCTVYLPSQPRQQQTELIEFDLGTDVELHQLSLTARQICCQGTFNVLPAAAG
jgi:hypothetical protein